MWIIAASAYTNRREDSPILMDFDDGWIAFQWMCTFLKQGRGVRIWCANTGSWYVQRSFTGGRSEYFVALSDDKVLTWINKDSKL